MHKAYWQLEYERNKDFYFENIQQDPFAKWDLLAAPDGAAERELSKALNCLYADQKELAQQYLRRAIAVAERALREDKCRSERCKGGYPRNEAQLLRALAYSRGLLGEQLDGNLFVRSATLFEESSRRGDWDPMAQLELLGGIRMALLAGEQERAAKTLKTGRRRALKDNLEEKELLETLSHARGAEDLARLSKLFKVFFDKVRDPGFKPPAHEYVMHRLDLGALNDKYFVSVDGAIDWDRVIKSVSE